MSPNYRKDTKNFNWRVVLSFWQHFCYQTQKPSPAEIDQLVVDLQPLSSELLCPKKIKLWFANTRMRPYPQHSIEDIDIARKAHVHVMKMYREDSAAKDRIYEWFKTEKNPPITINKKLALEEKKERQRQKKKAASVEQTQK